MSGEHGRVSTRGGRRRARGSSTRLPGTELKRIMEALLSAFPSRKALARMVRFHLDQNLNEIAGDQNLVDTAFDLVTCAEAEGRIVRLLEGAFAEAPNNPALLALNVKRGPRAKFPSRRR